MADNEGQWPSEHEDFDAVMDAAPARPTKVAARQPVKAAATTPIAVNEPAPEPKQAEPAPEPIAVEPETPEPTKVADTDAPEVPSEQQAEPALVPETPQVIAPQTASSPKPRRSKLLTAHIAFEVLLVVVIVALAIFVSKLQSQKTDLQAQVDGFNKNPQIVAQRQTDQIIKKVSSLMQLPSGETPTIANVSDAAKAREQSAFFKDAQNGDKVLMYVKAGQAILYRPTTDKIVLVAPLTFTNEQAAQTSSTTVKKP